MGTTCSALLLLPQGAVIGHVGDSRVYRLRGDEFCQLTFDHSLVWEMRATGQLDDDDESLPGIPRNVITRSLGPHTGVQVDLEGPFPIEVGDTFLICSDGLTGPLSNKEIATVLKVMEPEAACQFLIDLANMHGGPDNVTVVISKVVGPEMATRQRTDMPLTIGSTDTVSRNVHPAIWVAICVCALCAAVLLATDWPLSAAVAFGLFVVAALAACAYKLDVFGDGGLRLSEDHRLGKGPYRRTVDFSTADFCIKLAEKLRTAKDTVDARDWDVDWTEFEKDQRAAEELVASNRPDEALRTYAKAVHIIVNQARRCIRSTASDSQS
jgi:protein phosphatase